MAAAWPASVSAQTWQLTAKLLANAFMDFPEPRVTMTHNANLNLLNQPAAAQLQWLHEYSEFLNGGSAEAGFLGRVAQADFYHSAEYSLAPSVAGLNTAGASGFDYLAPVPEPAQWAVLLLGLAGLHWLRRLTPRALPAC